MLLRRKLRGVIIAEQTRERSRSEKQRVAKKALRFIHRAFLRELLMIQDDRRKLG